MPKPKEPAKPKSQTRKQKVLRLFPRISEKLFKGKDVMPAGRIERNYSGSGYFGNLFLLKGKRMPPGKTLVFHLMPIKRDHPHILPHRKYSWAYPGSVGHTAILIHPRKKVAIVTCIQGTVNFEKLPFKLRSRYRNWHIATLISAIAYCRNRGIKLYAIHPEVYGDVHEYYSGVHLFPRKSSGTIIDFYRKTLENAAKALDLKLREVQTKNVLGETYTKYFGLKVLKLL